MTLCGALARHADLLGPVSKQALQALAAFASGAEAARLRRLVSPAGAAEYKAWHCQSRSLLEVLEEFPGVRPPLGAPAPLTPPPPPPPPRGRHFGRDESLCPGLQPAGGARGGPRRAAAAGCTLA